MFYTAMQKAAPGATEASARRSLSRDTEIIHCCKVVNVRKACCS